MLASDDRLASTVTSPPPAATNGNGDGPHVYRIALARAPRVALRPSASLQLSGFADSFAAQRGMSYFASNGWVHGAIGQIAIDVSAIPLVVRRGRRTQDPEDTTGPLARLLEEPNDKGIAELLEAITVYLYTAGRAYLFMETLGGDLATGEVKELWPFRPDVIKPILDPIRITRAYEFRAQGGTIELPGESIAPFLFFNPFQPIAGGLSPLAPADLALRTLLHAGEWNDSFFAKGATLGLILECEEPLSPDQLAVVVEKLRQQVSGMENAFEIVIFDGGLKSKPATTTHKEMGFENLMRLTREEVFGTIKIPPAIAGDYKHLNLAQIDAQERLYYTKLLVPLTKRIAGVFNRCVAPRVQPGAFVHFDYSGIKVLQEDFDAKVRRQQVQISSGVRNPNEIRKEEGKPEYPGGEKFLRATNLVSVERADKEPEPVAPAPPAPKEEAAPGGVERSVGREVQRTAAWRRFDTKLTRAERRIGPYWETVLERVADSVVLRIGAERKRAPDDEPFDLEGEIEDYLEEVRRIIAESIPGHVRIYRDIAATFGADTAEHIAKGLRFDAGSPRFLSMVARDRERIGVEADVLLKSIRKEFEMGLAEGDSIGGLIQRIRGAVGGSPSTPARGGPNVRSERIARTEAHGAASAGTEEAYRQAGVEEQEWLSARDSFVRDSHAEADGQVVRVGEPFTVGGAALLRPGDPDGPPEEIINCRCATMPVLQAAALEAA